MQTGQIPDLPPEQGYLPPAVSAENQAGYGYQSGYENQTGFGYQTGYGYPCAEAPATAAIRQVASSGLFLASVILYSVSILLGILSSTIGSNSLTNQLIDLINTYGAQIYWQTGVDVSGITPYLYQASHASVLGAIVGKAIPILIAVALWLIYVSSKKPVMSKTGITIIKVVQIIGLVFMALALLLLLILCFLLIVLLGEYDAAYIGVIALVLLLLFSGFSVFYQVKIIGCISAASKAVDGDASGSFSLFVVVMMFIGVAFSVISGLLGLTLWSLLTDAVSIADSVIFALLILKARSRMEEVRMRGYGPQMGTAYENPSYME